MRVVSVLPSATEIVHRLGQGASLVGRSEECDYPAAVRSLPVVMRARTLDTERSSAAIDARVRAALTESQSLYELDVDLLARLRPDLLLTQDLCRVCSVTDEEVVQACRAADVAPEVLSLSPRTLEDVWSSIERIGRALAVEPAARELANSLRARTRPPVGPPGPRVAVLEWIDPPIESGLWTPELVRSAGGEPWSVGPGDDAPRLSWDALRSDPPELALVSPCSFSVGRTLRELGASEWGARLRSWPVPLGVWVADEAYFSRPGPRLADGRDLIRTLLEGHGPGSRADVLPWAAPSGGAS